MDLDKYKIILNIRTAMLFEELVGKSFFQFEDVDIIHLMYCSICANNNFNYSFETFTELLQNKKILNWAVKEMKRQLEYIEQFKTVKLAKEHFEEDEGKGKDEPVYVSELAAVLIVNGGLDAHFVNYELGLFEIEEYAMAIEDKIKRELEWQRVFTYLQIVPQLNPKKKVKMTDILPFPWEKKETAQSLDKKEEWILNMLNATKEEKKDGKG